MYSDKLHLCLSENGNIFLNKTDLNWLAFAYCEFFLTSVCVFCVCCRNTNVLGYEILSQALPAVGAAVWHMVHAGITFFKIWPVLNYKCIWSPWVFSKGSWNYILCFLWNPTASPSEVLDWGPEAIVPISSWWFFFLEWKAWKIKPLAEFLTAYPFVDYN